jgi:hypothetical protein
MMTIILFLSVFPAKPGIFDMCCLSGILTAPSPADDDGSDSGSGSGRYRQIELQASKPSGVDLCLDPCAR